MYEFALTVQVLAIVFCAIGTFLLYSRIGRAVSKNLLASSLFAMIFGVGYLMEMMARNEGEALFSLITQYIGLSCVALFFAIYVTELFHFFKVKKIVWRLCFGFNLLTFIGVLSSGYHNYYYKSMSFVENGLFPHLETENSIWFYAFMGLLLIMLIYSAALFIIATVRQGKKKINFLASIALIAGIILMLVSFVIGFNGYEAVSAVVCIVLGITSLAMVNSESTAILNKAYAESYMESAIGQIIVTKDMHFIECNKIAKKIYPPLAEYQAGQSFVIEGEGIVFDDETNRLHVGNRCYATTYQTLEGSSDAYSGMIIALTDVTALEMERNCDGLTGLYNRQAYFDKVAAILETHPERVDVLMSDLNGLKQINDTQGHAEGDRLIKDAASCFKQAFTEDSFIFRLGGDEFGVISTAGEMKFEEMLINLANAVDKINVGRDTIVSLSCGIAYADGTDDVDFTALMKKADEEMYINKRKYYEVNHIDRRHQ